MTLSKLKLYWILGFVAGTLGVMGYLFRDHLASLYTGRAHAAPRPEMTSHADQSAATASADSPESIESPRDRWNSAKLRVQVATKSAMTELIELTGKIALNEDKLAHVFPLVEGRVDEVRIRFGQRVKKGELLVIVQSKEVGLGMLQLFQDRLKLEFAEIKNRWTQDVGKNTLSLIEMMRAGDTIESIEQTLKDRTMGDYRERLMTAYVTHLKAQGHMKRLSPLSKSGAVPARQIMEAESDLNAARATLQSLLEQISQDAAQASRLATQTLKELETNIAVAETNLKILGFTDQELKEIDPRAKGEKLAHYPVTAPFDGTVISKDVVLLERVGPERQILAIADLSTVWVTADIYETHLPLLSQLADQTLRLRCDAWPEKRFEAKIFYTGDVVQEATRTIALRAMALNTEGLLKPGMFVTVELPSLFTGEVLQVPVAAIQDHEGQSFVFVQTGDQTFVRRDVTLGRRNREVVEIRSGVQVRDRVVVEGGFALKSKMLSDLLAE
jgi:cobalt-zinc-cadmium efflux system membrane fusion protein